MHSRSEPYEDPQAAHVRIQLFGPLMRWIWIGAFSITMLMEVMPRDPRWGPQLFYPYTVTKAILFLLLGFLTPLAIWNFSSLGFGILFAAAAAGAVEGMQHFTPGHRASLLEFTAKMLLLFLGFATALVVRNDHALQIGGFRLLLTDAHSSSSAKLDECR